MNPALVQQQLTALLRVIFGCIVVQYKLPYEGV